MFLNKIFIKTNSLKFRKKLSKQRLLFAFFSEKKRINLLNKKLKLGKINFQAEIFYLNGVAFIKHFRIISANKTSTNELKNFEEILTLFQFSPKKSLYYYILRTIILIILASFIYYNIFNEVLGLLVFNNLNLDTIFTKYPESISILDTNTTLYNSKLISIDFLSIFLLEI